VTSTSAGKQRRGDPLLTWLLAIAFAWLFLASFPYYTSMSLVTNPLEMYQGRFSWAPLAFLAVLGFLAMGTYRSVAFACTMLVCTLAVYHGSLISAYVAATPLPNVAAYLWYGNTIFMWLCILAVTWAAQSSEIRLSIESGLLYALCFALVAHFAAATIQNWLITHGPNERLSYVLGLLDARQHYGSGTRMPGLTPSPVFLGAISVFYWPAAAHLYQRASKRILRVTYLIVVFLSGICLALSGTRSAVLGFVTQVVGILYVAVRRKGFAGGTRKWAFASGIFIAGLIAGIVVTKNVLTQRFGFLVGDSDSSFSNRTYLLKVAFSFLLERPFCGYGAGTWPILYGMFYQLPNVAYLYPDIHSHLALRIWNEGLVGIALALCVVIGTHFSTTWKMFSTWMRVSIAGLVVPVIADSFYHSFALLLPLWIMGGLVVARSEVWRKRGTAGHHVSLGKHYLVPLGLLILWVVNFLLPPTSFQDRLPKRVRAILKKSTGTLSVHFMDLFSGYQWEVDHQAISNVDIGNWIKRDNEGRYVFPSVLATLACAAQVAAEKSQQTVAVDQYAVSKAAPTHFLLNLSLPDWVAHLIENPYSDYLPAILGHFPREELSAAALRWFGHPWFAQGLHELPLCTVCGRSNVQDDAERRFLAAEWVTSATAEQLVHSFVTLTDDNHSSIARVMRNALKASQEELGLVRYLPRGPALEHCAWYSGNMREEVLIYRNQDRSWAVAALFATHSLNIAPRPDNVANRVFAEIGWLLYCVYSRMDPLQRGVAIGTSTTYPKPKSWLWFRNLPDY